MKYNQTKTAAGQVMPLLMGCTKPTPIETESTERKVVYDPMTQRVVMDLRVIGTKSLRQNGTKLSNGSYKTDKKNEIDDSKSV